MANEPTKHRVARTALIAAAGIGIGYYFYGSKDAKAHRTKAAKWAADLKTTVVRQSDALGVLDTEMLAEAVDTAAKAYAKTRDLDPKKLSAAANKVKTHLRSLVRDLKAPKRSAAGNKKKTRAVRKK